MPATRIPRDFKEFLKSLDAHNARFLLIGGYLRAGDWKYMAVKPGIFAHASGKATTCKGTVENGASESTMLALMGT